MNRVVFLLASWVIHNNHYYGSFVTSWGRKNSFCLPLMNNVSSRRNITCITPHAYDLMNFTYEEHSNAHRGETHVKKRSTFVARGALKIALKLLPLSDVQIHHCPYCISGYNCLCCCWKYPSVLVIWAWFLFWGTLTIWISIGWCGPLQVCFNVWKKAK